jgi:hypothetical protein
MQKVYVVEAKRYGKREIQSYVVGVFTNKTAAEYAGEVEKSWRGGKYEYEITSHDLDYLSSAKAQHHLVHGGSAVPVKQYDDDDDGY